MLACICIKAVHAISENNNNENADVMEFGLKGTSRLVADVTGSRHSGLGFTVFWLFTAEQRR